MAGSLGNMQSGPSTPTLRWLNLLLIYISFVLHFFLTFINFVLSFFLIFYKDPLKVAARAPLMLAVPGLTDSGLRTRHLVEFVDIFPTIVEAAGLPILQASLYTDHMIRKFHFKVCPEPSNSSMLCTEGSSLMPLIENPESSDWKSAVFWQYPRFGYRRQNGVKV